MPTTRVRDIALRLSGSGPAVRLGGIRIKAHPAAGETSSPRYLMQWEEYAIVFG